MIRWQFTIALTFIVWMGWGMLVPLGTQESVPEKVMQYLKSHSFPELINRYGKITVALTVPSRTVRKLETLPYRLEGGFRVQVLATTDSLNARQVYLKVKQLQLDSTYLVKDDVFYKVQVGNFTSQEAGRKLLDQLYYAGFKDAWIAPATIHIPRKMEHKPVQDSVFFAIQILATHSRRKADSVVHAFRRQFNLPVRVISRGPLLKVLAGKFSDEARAREQLQLLRQKGWPDAWLTQFLPN